MKKNKISFEYTELENDSALPGRDRELLKEAHRISKNAYAPYSHFHVGATVLMKNGEVVTGTNQENVAYPSGLCAERVAFFAASTNFPGEVIEAVAVSCHAENFTSGKPFTPCGACRQVMLEYEKKQGKNIRVILGGETGSVYVIESVRDLLPLAFEADELKKNSNAKIPNPKR